MADQVNETVKDTVKDVVNEASEVTSKTVNMASNMVSQTTDKLKETITNLSTNSGALIGLIIVIVVALISSIVIYWLVVSKVFNKNSITIDKTKIPVKGFMLNEIPIENMPITANGFKKSFTFWIYLDNMNTGTDMYKRVFHIGSKDDKIKSCSPLVFIGKDKNELNIRFSNTTTDSLTSSDPSSLHQLTISDYNNFMKQGVTIEYLPMQRWVHVAVVVNETLTDGAGGMIHTYLDGELTSVTKTCDPTKINSNLVDCPVNGKALDNLNLDKTGSLIVGGTGKTDSDFGFNGLLSKVKIFNYDLNQNDVYNDYSEGPIDGLLNSLGYGLRTPIYKLSDL